MKPGSKIIISLMLCLMVGLYSTFASAQKPGKQNPGRQDQELLPPLPDPPPPPPPPGMQDTRERQHPDLPGLTDEQKEKMRQADLEHMKRMTPMRNQSKEKMARLQTILATTPFDGPAADQAAEELGKIRTGMLKESIRHDRAIRDLLTPEQQVIFDTRPKPFLKKGK